MRKNIFNLILAMCLILPFAMILSSCKFGDDSGNGANSAFTITAPTSNDNIFVNIETPKGSFGEQKSNDESKNIVRLEKNKPANLVLYFSDNYYYTYNVSNIKVKLDNNDINLPEFVLLPNINKMGCTIKIEEAVSQNHIITIDTSNISLKTISYNLGLKLNDLSLYGVNNANANGCATSDEIYNNRFEFLRNNWSIKYKLNFETEWKNISLDSVVDSNSLTVPINFSFNADKTLETLYFKIRYGNNYEFSLYSNSILQSNNQNIICNRDQFNNVIYDNDGYATYAIDASYYLKTAQTNTFNLSSPTARRKFALNYNDMDDYFLMKPEYNESTYYTSDVTTFGRLINYDMIQSDLQQYFIGQTIKFKGAKGYSGNIIEGSLPGGKNKYCFDEFCDYSDAKLYCGDTALIADSQGLYSFTFTSDLMENGEFNFKFKGIKANENGTVVKLTSQAENSRAVYTKSKVIKDGDGGYKVLINVFPKFNDDCIIIPKITYVEAVISEVGQLSSFTLNVIINGDRDSMQTSTLTNGHIGATLNPVIKLDLTSVQNKPECNYIDIVYEIIVQ